MQFCCQFRTRVVDLVEVIPAVDLVEVEEAEASEVDVVELEAATTASKATILPKTASRPVAIVAKKVTLPPNAQNCQNGRIKAPAQFDQRSSCTKLLRRS